MPEAEKAYIYSGRKAMGFDMSEKNASKKGVNKFVVLGVVSVIVISLVTAVLFYGNSLALESGIANGVYVGTVDLSGMDKEAAHQAIADMSDISADTAIPFVCQGKSFEISAAQIGLDVDTSSALEGALSYAKEGGFFKRVGEALVAKVAKKVFPPEYVCDEAALAAAIEENLDDKLTAITPYSVQIGKDEIIITNGTGGIGIEQTDLGGTIVEDIKDGKIDNTIVLTLKNLEAEPIDCEQFFSEYIRQPKDATYTEEDGNYVFAEEVVGIEFDKEEARAIIEANRNNTEPYAISATITMPKITVTDLQAKFASDLLASYSTSFASSDSNRAANVVLAASKINGVVLNPGERFSYNKIVGPRTVAAGFKIAHVYEGDRVVDGVGGGICQVSSTLYNTVLLSDLKIVSRTNHSMPVAYVPMGRDATVSYGSIDFVFENNKNYPVRIVSKSANRNLTIAIYGVKEDDTIVEIVTENAGYIPYSTKENVDNSLKAGEKKVVKNGSNGTIVNTYRVYKKDGVVLRKEHTAKSTYIPIARVVNVGPSPKEDKPTSEITPQVPDEETPKPQEPSKEEVGKEDGEENEPIENEPIENEPTAPVPADDSAEGKTEHQSGQDTEAPTSENSKNGDESKENNPAPSESDDADDKSI